MRTQIEARTQAELDAAVSEQQAKGVSTIEIILRGDGEFTLTDQATVHAGGQATVHAWDQATVRAWGQATVHAGGQATVRAWGQATVHAGGQATVHAWDQAAVHAWDQATVHAWGQATVRAWDQAAVHAWDQATVHAGQYVAVQILSPHAKIEGGVQIKPPSITTALAWAEYYALPVADGVIVVYKGLNDHFKSLKGGDYTPGTTPTASDWDGGIEECGGGFHACPKPWMTLKFNTDATRFVGCPVRLEDMRAPEENDTHPDKIKFSKCCAPCFEVDIDGNPTPTA